MKKYLKYFLLILILSPLNVFAVGGFGVSNTTITMYPGESKTTTITSNNAVGKLNISLSNGEIASVNTQSVFIQTPGGSEIISVTGKKIGTTTISVIASDDFATMDEEFLAGMTKTLTVNVIPRPTQPPTTKVTTSQPTTKPSSLSKNTNIKSIIVEGYDLIKVDGINYTLTIPNEVSNVNIKYELEDLKSKSTLNGPNELSEGLNTFLITVTSESGNVKVYKINITREEVKTYVENIKEVILNSLNSNDNVVVKIKHDDTNRSLDKEIINAIKQTQKSISYEILDSEEKVLYSLTFKGEDLNEEIENTNLDLKFDTENKEIFEKFISDAKPMYLNYKHEGRLPANTMLKLYLGNNFDTNKALALYILNEETNELELVLDNIAIQNEYVELKIDRYAQYVLLDKKIGEVDEQEDVILEVTEGNNLDIYFLILLIILIGIIGLLIYLVIKKYRKKKNSDIMYDINSINNNNINVPTSDYMQNNDNITTDQNSE